MDSSETREQESPPIPEHGFLGFRGKLRKIANSAHTVNLWSNTKAAVIRLGYDLAVILGILAIYLIITEVVSKIYPPQYQQTVDLDALTNQLKEYDRFVRDRRGGLRESLGRMTEGDRRSRT